MVERQRDIQDVGASIFSHSQKQGIQSSLAVRYRSCLRVTYVREIHCVDCIYNICSKCLLLFHTNEHLPLHAVKNIQPHALTASITLNRLLITYRCLEHIECLTFCHKQGGFLRIKCNFPSHDNKLHNLDAYY